MFALVLTARDPAFGAPLAAGIESVQLTAKAGFRFEKQQQITIVARPASTLPVHGVRLRNHACWATNDHSDGAPTFVGEFVAEAAEEFATKDEAVSVLASPAAPWRFPGTAGIDLSPGGEVEYGEPVGRPGRRSGHRQHPAHLDTERYFIDG